MNRRAVAASVMMLLLGIGAASAGGGYTTGYSFDGNGLPEYPNEGMLWAEAWASYYSTSYSSVSSEWYDTQGHSVTYRFIGAADACRQDDSGASAVNSVRIPSSSTQICITSAPAYSCDSASGSLTVTDTNIRKVAVGVANINSFNVAGESGYAYGRITITSKSVYDISGNTSCLSSVSLYDSRDTLVETDILSTDNYYIFRNLIDGDDYKLIFSDGAYYDFTCTGDEVFDYDACIWVYGYTCGVDSIKLYKDDGGWVLDDSVGQSAGYDVYEMPILSGEDYKISFIDSTIDGDFVVHNQTFSCAGDHVLIDFDRCTWIYPPNGPDIPIYLWTGYDYNVVVFKDNHGNMVENAELAVYDNTDNTYIQKWTGNKDGYALLGAKFNTDHDVLMMLRTFDGIFTLGTTYPANGSAPVGEEDITTTEWTIPIKYNLNVLPVDQYGAAMFDVFCGLSEYTPLNPQAFWGMDLSDRGYVPVTNCSGFAMCDIIAEKEGYAGYKVEALNWTSKSALVKDYRHNIVMEEE